MSGHFINDEPLSSPQNFGCSILPNGNPDVKNEEDNFLNNFKLKQSQFSMLDKIRLSNEASEMSILSQESDEYEKREGFKNKVWKDRALNIIVLVARFVTYLLTNSDKFKLRYLDHRQFKVIGDLASDFNFYLTHKLIRGRKKQDSWLLFKSKLKVYLNCLRAFALVIKPIKPDNNLKLYWDVIVFLILLINILYIPLKISFDIIVVEGADFFLDTLPQYIFLAEILLNFNVSYYSRGVLVLNRMQIVKHYLKGKFALDFIVLIPFMIGKSNIPYIEFVLLFRVSRVMYIFENLIETFNFRVNFASAVDIISLMSTFLFASHLIACVWHFIAIQEEGHTWIQKASLEDEHWQARYITSFYWACITTLTIGYGDIVPVTKTEQIFVIFVTLLSSIIFGYTISSIGQIFAQMTENKNYLRDKMTMIDSFLKKRGLNKDLQIKVKKFFEYYLKQERDIESECEKLMVHLSGNLNREVKIDFYKNLLMNSKLMRQNFSPQFIEKLCILVKEQSFVPEEPISIEGYQIYLFSQKVDKIYFILKGEVEAFISNNKIIKNYHRNQAIDEKSFISQHPALFSTRAIKFSKLAYITYDDLQELLKVNQEDREHFYYVKHQIEFGGRVKLGGCELCYQNHDFTKCPFVFYTPNSIRIFRKSVHDEKQKRLFVMRQRMEEKIHNVMQINIFNQNTLGSLRKLQTTVYNYCGYQGFLNDISPNSEFITSNRFNNLDSALDEPDYVSQSNSENESEKDPMPSYNLLMFKRDSRRKESDNRDGQSIRSKKKMTRVSIQKVNVNRSSGFCEKEINTLDRRAKLNTKKPTLIMMNQMKLDQSGKIEEEQILNQTNQLQQGFTLQTQGQSNPTSQQVVRQFEVDQVQYIEMEIANSMAEKECDIDSQREMDYYDVGFNLLNVITKLKKTKKKPIKFKKRKIRKSLARSQSIRHISQTRS